MSNKLTHEEFILKLTQRSAYYAQHNYEVIGTYQNSTTPIQCYCNVHHQVFYSPPNYLYNSCGCRQCGIENRAQQLRMTHEEFVRKVQEHCKDITVVGKYINDSTKVTFQCSHGHTWDAAPYGVSSGQSGCPYCSGQRVWVGFNDLWTTHPSVAVLLKNPEDGYKYSYGTSQKCDFICPLCHSVACKNISVVCKCGFSCPKCGDGISYPNKFGRALLDQLPIGDYQCEYQPDWAKPYFYDNYFKYNGVEYILEMDGAFHYEDNRILCTPVENQVATDVLKTNLATKYNINVIRINCLHSNKEYISNNILKSDLANIFDLSKIDWDYCDKRAQKGIVRDACELYMTNLYNMSTIAKMLHIHRATLRRYLTKGARFGWCNYNKKDSDANP